MYRKREKYSQDAYENPMLGLRETPADDDTQTCCLGPPGVMFRFDISIMGNILWLYQTQGLFKIYELVTVVLKLDIS